MKFLIKIKGSTGNETFRISAFEAERAARLAERQYKGTIESLGIYPIHDRGDWNGLILTKG